MATKEKSNNAEKAITEQKENPIAFLKNQIENLLEENSKHITKDNCVGSIIICIKTSTESLNCIIGKPADLALNLATTISEDDRMSKIISLAMMAREIIKK